MRAFFALLRREILSLLVAPYLYGILGVWFLLNGLFFVITLQAPAVQNDLTLLPKFFFSSGLLVWLLLPAFPPLLTLRLLAEEHRVGTLEPLLTAPIRDAAVVLAKYLASCFFFLLFWSGVLLLFLFLFFQGAPLDWSRVGGGFLGALCVSFLFLASGLWVSSWGSNLVLAAGGGAAINYAFLFLPLLLGRMEGPVGAAAREANIPDLLDGTFSAGMIDSFALGFFVLLAILFLFLTWIRLVSRRWVP